MGFLDPYPEDGRAQISKREDSFRSRSHTPNYHIAHSELSYLVLTPIILCSAKCRRLPWLEA